MKRKRAFFISIEGLEGSGKSSVIAHCEKYLRSKGLRIKVFREPGSTVVGEKIRRILLDKKNAKLSPHTELLLYLAARTQLIEEYLSTALDVYDVVICDRFFDSTLVYQGVALGLGKIVDTAVELFSLGIRPQATIVLDVPPQKGLDRLKSRDRIESRPLAFHEKLRRGYRRLAKREPERITIIDADAELAVLYKRIEAFIDKLPPFNKSSQRKSS